MHNLGSGEVRRYARCRIRTSSLQRLGLARKGMRRQVFAVPVMRTPAFPGEPGSAIRHRRKDVQISPCSIPEEDSGGVPTSLYRASSLIQYIM